MSSFHQEKDLSTSVCDSDLKEDILAHAFDTSSTLDLSEGFVGIKGLDRACMLHLWSEGMRLAGSSFAEVEAFLWHQIRSLSSSKTFLHVPGSLLNCAFDIVGFGLNAITLPLSPQGLYPFFSYHPTSLEAAGEKRKPFPSFHASHTHLDAT